LGKTLKEQGRLELKGKKALVMGLGLHDGGLGVARFLDEQGADVTVTDLRTAEVLAPTLEKLKGLPIKYVLGEHRESDFKEADLVIRNPAVPRESRFLQIAREAGASLEMEMTLFFKLCPSDFLLGITGTRGKTSTTLLTGSLLKEWRPDTVIAGNLRVSALATLSRITPDTPVVLELSSWQLEGLGEQKLSPRLAAVTNMSPDHLNRYRDMADYADAKRNIYRWQQAGDTVVLNADDTLVKTFAGDAPGKVAWTSLERTDLPGAYLGGNSFVWNFGGQHESYATALLKMPGRHSQANALTAIALAKAAGCPKAAIEAGLSKFQGVADRLELVRELDGVRFYNDTTATSPAGTVVALEAFGQDRGQIVLMAGGADKNLEFEPLARAVAISAGAGHLKRIIYLEGTATPRLRSAIEAAGTVESEGPYHDFREAVLAAWAAARPGDIVLLSPGAASFGMFLHEFDRGEQFRRLVGELTAQTTRTA
jgi:UDP-N-acetylmuramoylalanine--D-glutamate ligase